MPTYVPLQVPVDAVQWSGEEMTAKEVERELGIRGKIEYIKSYETRDKFRYHLNVETPDGIVFARPGDYIVKKGTDRRYQLIVMEASEFEVDYTQIG